MVTSNKTKPGNINPMKLNKLSLLASAFALTLTVIPFAAQAEINSSSSTIVAQRQKRGEWKNKLNLTEDQKAQMQQIKESARTQMQEILTPEQLEKLEAAKASGQKKREVLRSVNLTDAQKAEMKKVRESRKAQFEAILTDEQKAQLQEMKQNRQNRRRSSR